MKEEVKLVGYLAKSLAGHDKGTIYIIAKEQENYLYLVDGEIRCFNMPKKKNKKHVQMIHICDENVMERLCNGTLQDIHVKKMIKEYIQKMHQQEC